MGAVIHIHNGDSTLLTAKRSGLPGEHIAFRESLIAGPVAPKPDLETRARFLSDAYGANQLKTRTDLLEQENALTEAAKHDEVVLWFEHDLFCLVHFVYLLQRFSRRNVSVVWCPTPLGTQDEETLHKLYASRAAMTPALTKAAAAAWRAYTSADPTTLNAFIASNVDTPFFREGMALHASRFPSMRNGVGLVGNRILTLVEKGAADFATLFSRFDGDPPRLGFGDSELMRELRVMARASVPLITLTEVNEPGPPKALVALTPAADNVISGSVDYLALSDPDEWLGGAHVTRDSIWRWDEQLRKLQSSRPRVS
jgi:hypothetical protein